MYSGTGHNHVRILYACQALTLICVCTCAVYVYSTTQALAAVNEQLLARARRHMDMQGGWGRN